MAPGPYRRRYQPEPARLDWGIFTTSTVSISLFKLLACHRQDQQSIVRTDSDRVQFYPESSQRDRGCYFNFLQFTGLVPLLEPKYILSLQQFLTPQSDSDPYESYNCDFRDTF